MKESLVSIRVGLFFVIGIALLYITYTTLSEKRVRVEDGYTLRAEFTNLRTISPGADVRLAGVKIGVVQQTELHNGQAIAVLFINNAHQIPRDSRATIAMSGFLGGHYVSIRYGSQNAGPLRDGDVIVAEHTPDLNDMLAKMGEIGDRLTAFSDGLSGIGGEDMTSLFKNLNALISENRQRIDTILANFEAVSNKLNEGEGTIGKLLNSNEAYEELMQTVADIRNAANQANAALNDAREIVNHVRSGEGGLGELIYGEGPFGEFDAIIANLEEFSQKLNSDTGTLGKLVTDDELYREIRALISQAERALGSISDSGPMTAVGVASQALF